MTEVWKSNPMYWCDVCRCWLNDSKAARQHHEQGMGHKANLARKIREMGKKAEDEKRQKDSAASAMARIEEQARIKYEADKAAAAKEAEALCGRWTWDASCSYYYNERHRWYYDPKSKWYYGGEPTPEWKEQAPIPAGALFGTAPHEGGPVPQMQEQQRQQAAPAAGSAATAAAQKAAGASASVQGPGVQVKQVVLQLPKHPLAGVGGHQGPTIGRVGAAKGVGVLSGPAAKATTAGAAGGSNTAGQGGGAGDKRKRDGAGDKALSAEELEARARREAARQRVAERTAKGYGFL